MARRLFHILELIHWFSKDLLSTYYVPDTIQGIWVWKFSFSMRKKNKNQEKNEWRHTRISDNNEFHKEWQSRESGERDGTGAVIPEEMTFKQSSQWNGTVNRKEGSRQRELKPTMRMFYEEGQGVQRSQKKWVTKKKTGDDAKGVARAQTEDSLRGNRKDDGFILRIAGSCSRVTSWGWGGGWGEGCDSICYVENMLESHTLSLTVKTIIYVH